MAPFVGQPSWRQIRAAEGNRSTNEVPPGSIGHPSSNSPDSAIFSPGHEPSSAASLPAKGTYSSDSSTEKSQVNDSESFSASKPHDQPPNTDDGSSGPQNPEKAKLTTTAASVQSYTPTKFNHLATPMSTSTHAELATSRGSNPPADHTEIKEGGFSSHTTGNESLSTVPTDSSTTTPIRGGLHSPFSRLPTETTNVASATTAHEGILLHITQPPTIQHASGPLRGGEGGDDPSSSTDSSFANATGFTKTTNKQGSNHSTKSSASTLSSPLPPTELSNIATTTASTEGAIPSLLSHLTEHPIPIISLEGNKGPGDHHTRIIDTTSSTQATESTRNITTATNKHGDQPPLASRSTKSIASITLSNTRPPDSTNTATSAEPESGLLSHLTKPPTIPFHSPRPSVVQVGPSSSVLTNSHKTTPTHSATSKVTNEGPQPPSPPPTKSETKVSNPIEVGGAVNSTKSIGTSPSRTAPSVTTTPEEQIAETPTQQQTVSSDPCSTETTESIPYSSSRDISPTANNAGLPATVRLEAPSSSSPVDNPTTITSTIPVTTIVVETIISNPPTSYTTSVTTTIFSTTTMTMGPKTSPVSSSASSGPSKLPAIIGSVIGATIVVIIAFVVFCLFRRRRRASIVFNQINHSDPYPFSTTIPHIPDSDATTSHAGPSIAETGNSRAIPAISRFNPFLEDPFVNTRMETNLGREGTPDVHATSSTQNMVALPNSTRASFLSWITDYSSSEPLPTPLQPTQINIGNDINPAPTIVVSHSRDNNHFASKNPFLDYLPTSKSELSTEPGSPAVVALTDSTALNPGFRLSSGSISSTGTIITQYGYAI